MAVVSMKQLLESGVHFGHATRRWNPKMAPYIFTSRNGIHIIDLKLSKEKIEEAYEALRKIVEDGGEVLFVGTKKQAQHAVRDEAKRTGMYYVDQRWLGGTLTNFQTIRRSIRRLHELYKMEEDGTFEVLPKKEVMKLIHQRDKLERNLGGIKDMQKLPQAVYIVDPNKEKNAILEARKLGIPVFGIVDTNCDPDDVDYIIPANDDAIRAVNLITHIMGNAVIEAQGGYVEPVEEDDTQQQAPRQRRPRQERTDRQERRPREEKTFEKKKEEKPVVVKEETKAPVKVEEKAPVKVEEKAPAKKEVEAVDYNSMTVADLKALAKDMGLSGYSALRKAEVIELIKENVK